MNQHLKYNRIKVELTEAGKLNTDLSEYMQVHASTVSDWCTNTNQPSIQDLFRISEFLRIDVRKLLVPTNWEPESHLLVAEPTSYYTKSARPSKPGAKTKAGRKKSK